MILAISSIHLILVRNEAQQRAAHYSAQGALSVSPDVERKKLKTLLSITLLAGLLCGCGQPFLPRPTKKPVTPANVVGTWSLRDFRTMTENGPAMYYTATFSFSPDGTVFQTILPDGQTTPITNTGTWKLESGQIYLEHLLQEDWNVQEKKGEWTPKSAIWWMIHVPLNEPELIVFGGLFPDPDAYQSMKKDVQQGGPGYPPQGVGSPDP